MNPSRDEAKLVHQWADGAEIERQSLVRGTLGATKLQWVRDMNPTWMDGAQRRIRPEGEGSILEHPSCLVPYPAELPTEASEEANLAIASMLREYNYPANPQNAGRAGWRAARLYAGPVSLRPVDVLNERKIGESYYNSGRHDLLVCATGTGIELVIIASDGISSQVFKALPRVFYSVHPTCRYFVQKNSDDETPSLINWYEIKQG